MKYYQELANFRNEVNSKFPPHMSSKMFTGRNINEGMRNQGGRRNFQYLRERGGGGLMGRHKKGTQENQYRQLDYISVIWSEN